MGSAVSTDRSIGTSWGIRGSKERLKMICQ
jgi:hypothetical protein